MTPTAKHNLIIALAVFVLLAGGIIFLRWTVMNSDPYVPPGIETDMVSNPQ